MRGVRRLIKIKKGVFVAFHKMPLKNLREEIDEILFEIEQLMKSEVYNIGGGYTYNVTVEQISDLIKKVKWEIVSLLIRDGQNPQTMGYLLEYMKLIRQNVGMHNLKRRTEELLTLIGRVRHDPDYLKYAEVKEEFSVLFQQQFDVLENFWIEELTDDIKYKIYKWLFKRIQLLFEVRDYYLEKAGEKTSWKEEMTENAKKFEGVTLEADWILRKIVGTKAKMREFAKKFPK